MRVYAILAIFVLIAVVNADQVPCDVDLVIIQDMSNSIPEEDLSIIKEFDVNLTYAFDVSLEKSRVGLILYDKQTTVKIRFNDLDSQSPEAVQEILAPEERGRGSRLAKALTAAADDLFTPENGDRPDKRDIVIVITDGKSGKGDIQPPLQRLKDKGVDIFSVGVGDDINEGEMLEIALGQEDNVFLSENFDDLYTYVQPIAEAACYEGPVCEAILDLCIVQDMSNSIPEDQVPVVKDFDVELAHSFNVSAEGTHVGLIVFSKNPTLLIQFNDMDNQSPEAVEAALDPVERSRGTRTDRALSTADTEVFEQDKGDRPDRPNVLIMVTDGKSGGGDLTPILDSLASKNVAMFAIGVGDNVDEAELLEIALGQQDHVFHVDKFEDLQDELIQAIIDAACSE